MVAHREAEAADEEKLWVYDSWAGARDEVAAALSLTPRRASGQLRIAEALALRLPKTAELLESGDINARMAASIVYRTDWVSPAAAPVIDAEIALKAGNWTTHSDDDLELAVDALIEEHDPDAVRRYRDVTGNCDVGFGKPDDTTGTTSMFGRLLTTDAELAARVLNAMADTVCRHDPRNRGQLRAAGFGAVLRGHDRLVCQCGRPDCPAATIPSTVRSVVIHILAESGTLDAALAALAATQHFQPKNPDVAPPTVDLDALARNTEATAQETSPSPWDNVREDTEPETPAPTDTGYDIYLTPPPDGEDEDEPDWAHPSSASADAVGRRQDDTTDEDGNQGRGDGGGSEDDDEDPPFADPTPGTPPPGPDLPDSGTAATPHVDQTPEPVDATPAPPVEPVATPDSPAAHTIRPAVSLDARIIPTLLLAELLRTGATVKLLPPPAEDPEPHYAFSEQLRQFIKIRDQRCCFAGCNRKAEYLDIDHTIPHDEHGATHASNGKLLCREHHLMKTFKTGDNGWTDEQLLNGDIIWTAPTGHSYLTEPRARLLFPDWNTTTSSMPFIHPKHRRRPTTNKGTTMPTRQRTRAQDRQQRINTQREHNAIQRALDGPHGRPTRSPFR